MLECRQRNEANRAISIGKWHTDCSTGRIMPIPVPALINLSIVFVIAASRNIHKDVSSDSVIIPIPVGYYTTDILYRASAGLSIYMFSRNPSCTFCSRHPGKKLLIEIRPICTSAAQTDRALIRQSLCRLPTLITLIAPIRCLAASTISSVFLIDPRSSREGIRSHCRGSLLGYKSELHPLTALDLASEHDHVELFVNK